MRKMVIAAVSALVLAFTAGPSSARHCGGGCGGGYCGGGYCGGGYCGGCGYSCCYSCYSSCGYGGGYCGGGYCGGGYGGGGYCGGGYCYSGGSTGGGYAAVMPASNKAVVVVSLPANARLSINGVKTTATSSTRTFESPSLKSGKKYYYTFKAHIKRHGKIQTITKRVAVRAGKTTQISLKPTANAVSVAAR